MRQKILKIGILLGVIGLFFMIPSLKYFMAPAPAGVSLSLEEEKELNIYTWMEYIPPQVLKDFETKTGIRINIDFYDSNELPEAKLLTGHSSYDLVFPTAFPYLQRQIKAGVYEPLNRDYLPNWSNLDPDLLKKLQEADPGNHYAIPYLWGTNGIGYNIDCLERLSLQHKSGSAALLFDPQVVAKISPYGISLLDTPSEVFPAILSYLGRDPNSSEIQDTQAAAEALKKVRPFITHFSSLRFVNDLANGESCVAQGWSGDIRLARDQANAAGKGIRIGFTIPEEGAEMWCDVVAIPRHAPHPKNAHKFLNYLLEPKVIAFISNTLGYANANVKAIPYLDESIKNDPLVYPPLEAHSKFYIIKPSSLAEERLRTRLWTRVKTNK